MTRQVPIVINFPEIVGWAQKIYDLLGMHVVAFLGGKGAIVCVLNTIEQNNRVQVTWIADRPG